MINLNGATVLITGASRGIGAASAKLFAQHGANVAINYWSRADKGHEGSAQQVLSEIKAMGGKARLYNANITNELHVSKMVEEIQREFGCVTHLILNAFLPFKPKPFLEYEWTEFESKTNADIKSCFTLVKAVLPSMVKKKSGVIIGVSSGLSRNPTYNFSPYCVSKSALNAMIRSIALEYGADGIRANVVAPGFTLTDPNKSVPVTEREAIASVTPLRRIAMPEDIANAIILVASEKFGFVSGGYFPVDGGLTML